MPLTSVRAELVEASHFGFDKLSPNGWKGQKKAPVTVTGA